MPQSGVDSRPLPPVRMLLARIKARQDDQRAGELSIDLLGMVTPNACFSTTKSVFLKNEITSTLLSWYICNPTVPLDILGDT